jgi:hypothetical protein
MGALLRVRSPAAAAAVLGVKAAMLQAPRLRLVEAVYLLLGTQQVVLQVLAGAAQVALVLD